MKEEEERERKRVELEAELLRLSIIHHREVHVMSEVHCTSLNEKHQRILNYFQAAPELQTLAQLKLLEQGCQRGTHVEDIITGLKDYDADTRTGNLFNSLTQTTVYPLDTFRLLNHVPFSSFIFSRGS